MLSKSWFSFSNCFVVVIVINKQVVFGTFYSEREIENRWEETRG